MIVTPATQDSSSETDDDGDGVDSSEDQCPDTPTGEAVDANGCSSSQIDSGGEEFEVYQTPVKGNIQTKGFLAQDKLPSYYVTKMTKISMEGREYYQIVENQRLFISILID